MAEHMMAVVPDLEQDWNFALLQGGRPSGVAGAHDDVYLCGNCGIIVARNLSRTAQVAATVRCGNCGALNAPHADHHQTSMAAGKPEVAVLDDEPGVLDVLCTLIEMEGFQPICLEDPGQVDDVTRKAHPSLFLIDIMLPGTSGIEVAQRLRQAGFEDTPMVAMSASGSMVAAAKSSGLFQDVIAKPFELDTVVETVERYVA